MTKEKETDYSNGETAEYMKDLGKTENKMVKADLPIKKEYHNLENGRTERKFGGLNEVVNKYNVSLE